jgi:hypothetical protein
VIEKSYVVFDAVTGKIQRTIICPPLDVKLNIKAGEVYMEGIEHYNTHKVRDGKITEKTKTELATEKQIADDKMLRIREQNLAELRMNLFTELSVVDPNVISLLKKLGLIPEDL